jgi:hypothetical protein
MVTSEVHFGQADDNALHCKELFLLTSQKRYTRHHQAYKTVNVDEIVSQ